MSRKEFKVATYERLTKLAVNRLTAILDSVKGLSVLTAPLSHVQLRTLTAYSNDVKVKRADFEANLRRLLDSPTASEIDDSTLSEHQEQIYSLCTEITSMIEVILPGESPLSPSTISDANVPTPATASTVRLPKLDLQKFSGDLSTWTSFFSLYETTIHKNASLTSVIKFQYLISVLSGEPLNLIKGLSLTAANYLVAYDLLRERYHNPRRLVTLHLNSLLDLPQITISSTKGLRQFTNAFTEHSQALKALDCDITTAHNPLLSALLLRKMDNELRKKLEAYRASQTDGHINHSLPQVKDIITFLNTECSQIEDASIHDMPHTSKQLHLNVRANTQTHKKQVGLLSNRDVAMIATKDTANNSPPSFNKALPCFCCNQNVHKIYTCVTFKNKTPQERHQIVKSHHRCISCLGNHNLQECRSQATCQKCHKRHHTLLHFESATKTQSASNSNSQSEPSRKLPSQNKAISHFYSQPKPTSEDSTSVTMTSQGHTTSPPNHTTVLLGTLLVKLKTSDGNSYVFRGLLDSGSMCDLISERAAQILKTTRYQSNVQLSGLAQNMAHNNGLLYANIETLSGHLLASNQPLVILNNLTMDLPRIPISPEVLKRTHRYLLADPTFHLPGTIDIVLGGALFPSLLTNKQYSLGPHMPYVVGTHCGYVVMGSAPGALSAVTGLHVMLHATTDLDLHSSIQKFWQQEEPPVCSKQSEEERLCDKHFSSTHSRDQDGRYIVRLPFKEAPSPLGSSQLAAERRLQSLERKFIAQPHFSALYHDFMHEYISLGHMAPDRKVDFSAPHYFLPHHGVLKESSSTTKLRTVFDASSKSSTGISLNDILLTGPKLQTNICDILLHFRSHRIVFSCDIRQMYRQIIVHPSDRVYQLILWRETPDQEITTFKLNTVTYGMNSSPYLAIRTLHQLADDEGDTFPAAAHVLRTQTYVDDIISGADTEEEAAQLQDQLISLLRRGGFELRKWVSNSQQLLQALPEGHLESPVFLQESNQPHFSILGLHWAPASDHFTYKLNLPLIDSPTKRSVLSAIAKIYDPCGFLAPCIMLAKCFMQFLWTTGLTWDEPLHSGLADKWHSFVREAHHLSQISIPRAFHFCDSHDPELHGFADASESGYAAVIYFRSQLKTQHTIVRLVMAKTRVAPLKRVTLPRLELCAAHLLAQLVAHCLIIFKDKIRPENIYLWSDSSVVLNWLRTPSYKLKTFVANRVSQTQELVCPEAWHHISSSDNPADCASRGIYASQLADHPLWWSGPSWLCLPHSDWPISTISPVDLTSSDELKQTPLTVLTTTRQEDWNLLLKFSSWNKLLRTMAWVIRFTDNCRSTERRSGPLTLSELTSAKRKIFVLVQQSAFSEDMSLLKKQRECSLKLQRLQPFIDNDGLIRAGGRLKLSTLSQDVRHPVILPKSHHIVNILIDHYHVSHLHAGAQLTQALLTKTVWILSARQVIRSRIFKCITCFRNKPRVKTPLMGDLPTSRVTPARPFLATGLDYAGPITAKTINLRSVKHFKVYLCIFICMVTKAVHIEVVTDLTAPAFIAALTRFVSRRGLCADIYSDCGTNFVGADATLRRIVKAQSQEVQHFATSKGIRFHFNPPAAPHQGGLWESAVKSAKHHLRRVMGDTVLTLPELTTLTTQIEAMLNSRPLTPLSSDPADLSALTPGHFLIGAPLAAVSEDNLADVPQNRLRHWQLVQAFHQRIWHRWHLEYIHTLQQRSKWTHNSENLKVGDLVLVHAPTPPLSWPLARITKVHPGADGVVRVVDLRSANGSYTRPVLKVFPLPMN